MSKKGVSPNTEFYNNSKSKSYLTASLDTSSRTGKVKDRYVQTDTVVTGGVKSMNIRKTDKNKASVGMRSALRAIMKESEE